MESYHRIVEHAEHYRSEIADVFVVFSSKRNCLVPKVGRKQKSVEEDCQEQSNQTKPSSFIDQCMLGIQRNLEEGVSKFLAEYSSRISELSDQIREEEELEFRNQRLEVKTEKDSAFSFPSWNKGFGKF